MSRRSGRRLLAVGALFAVLTACAAPTIPADPDGTLERVRAEGILHAGASPNPPHARIDAIDAPPTGPEVDLVDGFAQRVGVRVQWVVAGESSLIGRLEDGEVDIVVGGLLEDSPWEERVSLTRPYSTSEAADGTERSYVMAVPMGENALLSELERHLDEVGS